MARQLLSQSHVEPNAGDRPVRTAYPNPPPKVFLRIRDFWQSAPVRDSFYYRMTRTTLDASLHGRSRRSLMDATNPVSRSASDMANCGTKDGSTAADHDQPYRVGLRPTAKAPFPFTERQFARLLILRGRLNAEVSATEHTQA